MVDVIDSQYARGLVASLEFSQTSCRVNPCIQKIIYKQMKLFINLIYKFLGTSNKILEKLGQVLEKLDSSPRT